MNIKLNNGFSITSTQYAFCLNVVKVKGEGSPENVGDEYIEKVGEYSSLEQVFNGYLNHSTRESCVESIEELIELIKSIRDEIGRNYTINLKDL